MGASKVEQGLCKDEDIELNFVLQLVMSSLSVIGSSCIIVSYYLMPKNQKAKILRCLLVWLSAMDLGASSAYLLSPLVVNTDNKDDPIKNDSLCTFQAISSTFCSMSSFLTTCLIGIYLHQAVIRDTSNQRWKVIHTHSGTVFLLVAILFPLALCFVVLGNGKFGFSQDFGEQWCWIKSNSQEVGYDKWDTFMWRMVGGKAVELSTLVVIIFTYIPTMLRLRKLKLSEGNNSISRLAFVPGAFVILRFPSLIRTVLDIVADTADNADTKTWNCIEFLSILQSLGDPSQGFVNGLAYCVGSIKMRRVLCRAFCCRKEENDGVVTWEDTNERLRDTSATGTGAGRSNRKGSKKRSRQGRPLDSNGNSWRDSSGVGPDIDKCISDSDNDEERYVLDDELDEEMGEPGDGSSGTSGTSGTNSNNSFEDDNDLSKSLLDK
ncbi:hypothetical protein TrVE_jg5172 [Triparma verrucosa]|uniref:G-protein coupled receptors family 2 profile 2 domain-containing protein n=1 Tax=Triparma verrucosa TaxID=1606542 RepID=A0A9W7EQ46_9STRA|nr:hypothetical protein TrVE_jg5172 [Triparma verrucosa]